MSKKLKIVFNSQIFSSFIPCGILEFLNVPQNGLARTAVSSIDRLLRRIIPYSLVPHKTIMIEAVRAGPNQVTLT